MSQNSHTKETTIPSDSVGIVTPKKIKFDDTLTLECNRQLNGFELMVETYGELNKDKSNAILICHALSGDHHAAGLHDINDKKPGWWDNLIGKNKAIDTNKFFVVAFNNLGGCSGSTGPISPNPNNQNKAYGADFPVLTIVDLVNSQALLSDKLGIDCWYAVIGGSMGGMQAMQWSIDYPERLKNCIIIASTPKLTAQNIAFNEVARQSILSDPDFNGGQYLESNKTPKLGLKLARMVGHLTYMTENTMNEKFARDLKSDKLQYGYDVDFEVESYLRYQGEQFTTRFDANTYLNMTKALDYFEPAKGHKNEHGIEDLQTAFSNTKCRFLVVSFTTDWRFSPEKSQEIVNAIMANNISVSYINVDAPQGHDAFLFPIPRYVNTIKAFLEHDPTNA